MKKNTLLFISCWIVQLSFGTTFYIDPIGGSDSGDGTIDNPWKTLEYIINNNLIESRTYTTPYDPDDDALSPKNIDAPVKDGDTLLLYSGLHGNIQIVNYNNLTTITVKAAEDEIPILKKLHFQGSKNWIFDGVTISSEPYDDYIHDKLVFLESHAWQGPVSNITIKNCLIYSTTAPWTIADDWLTKVSDGIFIKGDSVTIENNMLSNIGFGVSMRGDYIIVRGNEIKNFSADGIRLIGSNSLVESNTIKNCYNIDENHDDGIQSFTTGGLVVDNNIIRRNIILNYEDASQPLLGPLQGIGCFDGPFRNWTIENNVVIVDHWHGISLYGAIDCAIINNTVLDPSPAETPGPTWIKTEDISGYPSTGCIVKNNVSNSLACTPSTALGNNVQLTTLSEYTSHFLNYSTNDYHLQESSSLVNVADISVAPSIDLDGISRPQGIAPDVGAYEFDLSSGLIKNESVADLSVFPNPFSDQININGNLENCTIEIIAIDGKVIAHFSEINLPYSMLTDQLIKGVYILKIKNNERNEIYNLKLIK